MAVNPAAVPQITLKSGVQIPCIGMGTFGSDRFSAEEVAGAVAGGLRVGYRMFDCAACYGNEAQIGEVFHKAFDEGLVERKDLFIMTKVWNDRHREVGAACRQSIQDLRCEYIDLYYIHWPFPNYHPPGCDVDSRNPDSKPFSVAEFLDTYRQCEQLVREGLVKHIGISNMTLPKLEAVLPKLDIMPAACELEIHPCFQQEEQFAYLTEDTDIADMELPEMRAIAKAHGVHPAIVCLKWAFQRGQIPIPFSIHNYEANLEAALSDPLTGEEMKTIASLEKGNRLVKGQVFLWEGARDWHDLWDEDGKIVDCPDA